MKFLFTAPRYHTNQHFAAKALMDAGHQVSFLVLRRGGSEVYDALDPIVLGTSPFLGALAGGIGRMLARPSVPEAGLPPVLETWRRMRRLRADVVIVRNPNSGYGMLAIVLARLLGSRVVFYTQGPMYRRIGRSRRRLLSIAVRVSRAAAWITPVLGHPDRHPAALPIFHYLPFVIEPRTGPREKRWFEDDVVNILAIGKFQSRKNHRLFLQVIGRLARRYSIKATIIGECSTKEHDSELSRIGAYIENGHLGDIVTIHTNMPYSRVQLEYARHDVFVLPSRDEPAAVSLLEAMAHSLPVICSDSNGTRCYIRPGENGFVFRADDPDDLESSLSQVVGDRRRLMEMGRRSHELVVHEHPPSRFVETLLAIAGSGRVAEQG